MQQLGDPEMGTLTDILVSDNIDDLSCGLIHFVIITINIIIPAGNLLTIHHFNYQK
jgi:hypothetical protein